MHYQLQAAGTYRIVLAAADYRAANYRVTAERVRTRAVSVPSAVSGSIGNGARIAVLSFDLPPDGVSFETQSAVASTIVDGSRSDNCSLAYDDYVLGPRSLLSSWSFEPEHYPLAGDAAALSHNATYAAGRHLLVVSGAPGTRFRGTLTAQQPFGG